MNASAPAAVRAAVLEEIGAEGPYARSRPLQVRELGLAQPGPGELLVRVRAAGLCHSDLSVVNGDRPRPVPMVLGHEAAGEVVAVGSSAADRFAAGDHVVLFFVAPCGDCAR
ncbi:alcohol dehydrogenase catalytic domain-containing protein, partial [Streptomonospora algeriensis]